MDCKTALAMALTLLLIVLVALPAWAGRELEWRGDELWVADDEAEDVRFGPVCEEIARNPWCPRAAALSPDGEWVAFVRHTGGGFENEGQSCFAARWDGADERLVLPTDFLIPGLHWLEGKGVDFVVVQQTSGGTLHGSFFSLINFESGEIVAQVEGRIYGTSRSGARHTTTFWDAAVGLRYEVLGRNEEPCRWGAFYVDELIDYGPCSQVVAVDGEAADGHPLVDGRIVTAWIAPSDPPPFIALAFEAETGPGGLCIVSGWSWHQPPAVGEVGWAGTDWYPLYDRPRLVRLTFSDGSESEVELSDTRCVQWIGFPENAASDAVTLTVLSVYRGIEFDQVAISEVYLF